MAVEIIEGHTQPFIVGLQELDEGVLTDLNATGFTATSMVIKGNDGSLVDTASKFSLSQANPAQVTYSPAATDFVTSKSPYRFRITLTDGSGKTRAYPSSYMADEIIVGPAA